MWLVSTWSLCHRVVTTLLPVIATPRGRACLSSAWVDAGRSSTPFLPLPSCACRRSHFALAITTMHCRTTTHRSSKPLPLKLSTSIGASPLCCAASLEARCRRMSHRTVGSFLYEPSTTAACLSPVPSSLWEVPHATIAPHRPLLLPPSRTLSPATIGEHLTSPYPKS
jgi:hypothetical protein